MTLRDEIERAPAESIVDVPQGDKIANSLPVADPSFEFSAIVAFLWQRQMTLEAKDLADRIEARTVTFVPNAILPRT
jgi:hypothetical protein